MSKWPKKIPELTAEQLRIRDDFMKHWHEVMPNKYGIMERFNHGFPVKHAKVGGRVIEIGAGLGGHIACEDLSSQEYYAVELRQEMADVIKNRFPNVTAIVGNCENRLEFQDSYFDRAIAIHVLEHLFNLPAALAEIRRLLKPDGEFAVVIPCEGGLAYSFARRISAQRIFEKRYHMPYDWCIQSEHINMPHEIFEEIRPYFEIKKRSFFPLVIPSVEMNLAIGLILVPRQQ